MHLDLEDITWYETGICVLDFTQFLQPGEYSLLVAKSHSVSLHLGPLIIPDRHDSYPSPPDSYTHFY